MLGTRVQLERVKCRNNVRLEVRDEALCGSLDVVGRSAEALLSRRYMVYVGFGEQTYGQVSSNWVDG